MAEKSQKKPGPLARLRARRETRKKPMAIPRGKDLTASGAEASKKVAAAHMDLGPENMRGETVDARIRAAHAVSAAICRAAASPDAGETVSMKLLKRRPSDGALRPTGTVEGLTMSPNLTRHAYAHALRSLEQAGLAACEWNDVDGARMPIRIEFKASDAARIAVFLAVGEEKAKRRANGKQAAGGPSAVPAEGCEQKAVRYDARGDSPALSADKAGARREAGRELGKAFLTLAAKHPAAAAIKLQVFDPPDRKRSEKSKESGLCDLRAVGKKKLGNWSHPLAEAEKAGLVRLEWGKLRGRRFPSTATAAASDVPRIAEFFGVSSVSVSCGSSDKARACARAHKERKACGDAGALRAPDNPGPAGLDGEAGIPAVDDDAHACKAAGKAGAAAAGSGKKAGKERARAEALADAALLLDAAEVVGTGPLAMHLATAADEMARRGRTSAAAIEKAREGRKLGELLAVVSRYPAPLAEPVELRVASAAALGNSKALDGSLGKLLARLLEESGAAPSGSGDALSRWGFTEAGARIWIGGDALLRRCDGTGVDLRDLSADWCAPAGALARAASIDPRGCRAVVAVENLAAWRQAVRDLGTLAVFVYVDGWMCGGREECLASLMSLLPARLPLLIWNDADAGGFQRFDSLSRDFPSAVPVFMDCETLACMRDAQLREMNGNQRATLEKYLDDNPGSRFSDVGRALLRRGRFLEQEALLGGYAQERLGGMLRGLPRA